MDIATRWNKWHLEKKYTDFVELHKYLSKEFDNLPEVLFLLLEVSLVYYWYVFGIERR